MTLERGTKTTRPSLQNNSMVLVVNGNYFGGADVQAAGKNRNFEDAVQRCSGATVQRDVDILDDQHAAVAVQGGFFERQVKQGEASDHLAI